MDSNILNYSCLEPLNVSRETFPDLEEFRQIIIQKNRSINLISKQSEQVSKERHIIDSAQIIDFIDLNLPICTDIGSGSGLPGIVLAIIMKHKKSEMKFKLYEKSYHKSNFLKEVSNKFNLNFEKTSISNPTTTCCNKEFSILIWKIDIHPNSLTFNSSSYNFSRRCNKNII